MSARVELKGMAEFRQALRQLPDELASEGSAIVDAHAQEHARVTEQIYGDHQRTGRLRRGVTTQTEHGRAFAGAIVRTRAPHAWLFDNGSRTRRTGSGANRGMMPARPESERFVPRAIRARVKMMTQLKDLVRRAGFVVS